MKYYFFLLAMILTSCNSKIHSEEEYLFSYRMIIKDNEDYNKILIENISEQINNSRNSNLKIYDSLTNNYLKYLSKIENEIEINSSDIFFSGYEYSSKGKEFINNTNLYKNEIERLVTSANLKRRINYVLNTNNVQLKKDISNVADNNQNNVSEKEKMYAYFLDYYIKGFPKLQTLSYFSSKKRQILELQNEFNITEDKIKPTANN